jgi:hypothetical protein
MRDASRLGMTKPSAPQTEHLFERMIFKMVVDCVDLTELIELEETLAIELGRRPDVSDQQMLAIPRTLIARALHEVADAHEHGGYLDTCELRTRYHNALGREAESG